MKPVPPVTSVLMSRSKVMNVGVRNCTPIEVTVTTVWGRAHWVP